MGLGIAAIALSIICLLAGFFIGASVWLNVIGLVAGVAGLFLLGRKKKDGGSEWFPFKACHDQPCEAGDNL